MIAETEWYPERLFLLWIVKRRLWSNFAGSAYQMHKYKNGLWIPTGRKQPTNWMPLPESA